MKKILIVDDEQDIIDFLGYNLKKEGFEVLSAHDGASGIEMAKLHQPDLILLDVMMPKMDGIEVCMELRELRQFENTLISFLTARGEDYSQLAGFKAGGDEYITKPIKPKILIARIKALLKREKRITSGAADEVVSVGCIQIDKERMLVIKDGKSVQLTKMEFDLLLLLTSKPGKVFTREHIHKSLWGSKFTVKDRTMDVHIRKLRVRIGEECIKTIKGAGYLYNEMCI